MFAFARFAAALLFACAPLSAYAHAGATTQRAAQADTTAARIDGGGMSQAWTELSWSETVEVASDEADGQHSGADDAATGTVTHANVPATVDAGAVARFVDAAGNFRPTRAPIARFGPFYLVTPDRVEMIGTVDSRTPAQFAALVRLHPGIRTMVMIECPGSVDEDANHALARAVRAAGIDTVVPDGGSVRSGAVDLFLAGVHRRAGPGAEFGVHSWRDEDGREAADFPANDPVHAEYIAYYRAMGLSDDAARRFYALTNSVPFEQVRTLSARQMAQMGLAELAPDAS
jgi:hypothetical protein